MTTIWQRNQMQRLEVSKLCDFPSVLCRFSISYLIAEFSITHRCFSGSVAMLCLLEAESGMRLLPFLLCFFGIAAMEEAPKHPDGF